MTAQTSILTPKTVDELRVKGAAVVENVVQTAEGQLAQATDMAKEMASDVQARAEKLGHAAMERGGKIADAAARELGTAGSGLRDFARRNPELVIAGAALAGYGIATWLHASASAGRK